MENLGNNALHTRLQKAIDGQETIEIKYRKYSGEESERKISDIHWSSEFGDEDFSHSENYINAFCHLRQERRTFKLTRILSIDGEPFQIAHEMDSSKGIFHVPQVELENSVDSPTVSHSPIQTGEKEVTVVREHKNIFTPSQTSIVDVKKPTKSTAHLNNGTSVPPYTRPTPRKEGCYIATMAYGSYEHPQVLKLRRFRDNTMLHSVLGTYFVKLYYFTSPKLVAILKGHDKINLFIRKVLDCFIKLIAKD